jgi:hypothetical protein
MGEGYERKMGEGREEDEKKMRRMRGGYERLRKMRER